MKYTVCVIPKKETYPWLLKKHYARKLPNLIINSFGLYNGNELIGVITYGISGNKENNTLGSFDILELTRLVIKENLPKNTCSYFISQTFKLLPKPLVLISYSDTNFGHNGYVYQATNWIYTGKTSCRYIFLDKYKNEIHEKTIYDRYKTNKLNILSSLGFTKKKKQPKHRYFYLIGNKVHKKKMLHELKKKYGIYSYPKGNNKKYDASYNPIVQKIFNFS